MLKRLLRSDYDTTAAERRSWTDALTAAAERLWVRYDLAFRLRALGLGVGETFDAGLAGARRLAPALFDGADRFADTLSARIAEFRAGAKPDAAPVFDPNAAIELPQQFREAPHPRIYAVGDIHGRADLLEDLLCKIADDSAGLQEPPHIVFLGDYIDRGLEGRRVVDMLLALADEDVHTHFLKGNHEDCMLRFIEDPSFGPRWGKWGGAETLVSYGVQPPRIRSDQSEWNKAHESFVETAPQDHLDFLRELQSIVRIGPYAFVHAGARPGTPLDVQSEHDLLWIRDEFLDVEDGFDAMIVHGHTPTETPHIDDRRINVDTGAYLTGKLTAARLDNHVVSFIMTQD